MRPVTRISRYSNRCHLNHSSPHTLLHHFRHILQFANTPPSKSANEPPVRLSTQYPPPPLTERYSRPIAPSNAKIEPYKDVQFKPKEPKTTYSGDIPIDLQENNIVDSQAPLPSSPEEELSLGGVEIDPLELKKMIPHGTASKEEIESALNEENAEWKGVHWSERHYTAKLGDIVQRQRPDEISRLMESSKPPVHREGLRSIQPVTAGGPAYPIFFDPKQGVNRPQAMLPKDIDGRKSRVTHIASLQKVTGLNHSECALEYDYAHGQYSIALERLRDKQVNKLVELTKKPKEKCKQVFDQKLGNFHKAFTALSR